ncbi:hypothetical protein KNP414_06015 [Paenibacillus mucilaginosus KNP414]|uniref:Uncharacterized protein n=1 Tax=Paenibacillus mucilaginosus (strain KNP414) TaxID=1036673 RepID=F8FEE0_PAEMK|nr:hypothetical protein KNP414_06015 [Paenibacillus mucilaginosus KNP414]
MGFGTVLEMTPWTYACSPVSREGDSSVIPEVQELFLTALS